MLKLLKFFMFLTGVALVAHTGGFDFRRLLAPPAASGPGSRFEMGQYRAPQPGE